MKIKDIISYADKTVRNDIDQSAKIMWLSRLDSQILHDIFQKDAPDLYAESSELSLPGRYADVYEYYLMSMISLTLGETVAYQNYNVLYESAYDAFSKEYIREHTPQQSVRALKFT